MLAVTLSEFFPIAAQIASMIIAIAKNWHEIEVFKDKE